MNPSDETNPDWLRTDEWADVTSSLVHLAKSLQLAGNDPREWKWAIVASHMALHGALVCVLSGSNGLGCLTDKSMKEVLDWMEVSRNDSTLKYPVERVAELPKLLDRAYDAGYMNEFGGFPIQKEPQIDKDIRLLHSLRNQFSHFRPASWHIEIIGLPRVIWASIETARRILLTHPACVLRLEPSQKTVLVESFREVFSALAALGFRPAAEVNLGY